MKRRRLPRCCLPRRLKRLDCRYLVLRLSVTPLSPSVLLLLKSLLDVYSSMSMTITAVSTHPRHVNSSNTKISGKKDGVFNVVLGAGDVGHSLAAHPDVAKISFTGSLATGTKVAQTAAADLKKVSFTCIPANGTCTGHHGARREKPVDRVCRR